MVKPGVHHLGAVSLEVGKAEIGKFETGARKRHRKPNLERTLLGAKKAGFNVAGASPFPRSPLTFRTAGFPRYG
jgi:hypothetical protein